MAAIEGRKRPRAFNRQYHCGILKISSLEIFLITENLTMLDNIGYGIYLDRETLRGPPKVY